MKQFVDSCVPELAVPVRVKHLNVGQEESGVASADGARPASRAHPAEWSAMSLSARPTSRHTYDHPPPNPHVHQVARQMRVRGVVVELAVQQIREFDLVDPRPVRFEPLARVSARHALSEHDAVNASSVRSDAAPF